MTLTLPSPHLPPRLLAICLYGSLTLVVLWFTLSRESWGRRRDTPATILDTVAMEALGHPMFDDIREYERHLPQHAVANDTTQAQPRYLFFPEEIWGAGWNNILEEQLLNTHLAYLSNRAYVFVDYIARDHPPFPDKLGGVRHLLHVPMNAFVSGPTGGGPLSMDGESDIVSQRAISETWWNTVCPRERVVTVKIRETLLRLGLDDSSDGVEMMSKLSAHLRTLEAPCVSIESPFDFRFFVSERVLSLWPSYSVSPTLKNFAWSPLIAGVLYRNIRLLSLDPPPSHLAPAGVAPRPYPPSEAPFPGLLGLHIRRGDFKDHCLKLAKAGTPYNAWNQFSSPAFRERMASRAADYPDLPDYLDIPAGQSRKQAAMTHCWPTPQAIVQRARSVREASAKGDVFPPQALRAVFVATNGKREWVQELTRLLKDDGWEMVSSTFDMNLTLQERAVEPAVDMAVLTAAESFIGVGFSSLTSNVAQLRLASGRHPHTIRFW